MGANDVIAGCEPVTIEIMSLPEYGIVVINNPTQSVVFIPDVCYEGPDEFTYRLNSVSCGKVSNTATVAVTIESPKTLVTCNGVFITCNGTCLVPDC